MSTEPTNSKNKKTLSPQLRFMTFKDEWSTIKMSDGITFISGFAFESSKMLSKTGKYQLIKMSNVYKSELQLDRSPSYWNQMDERTEKVLLRKGDIILTLTGTVGKRDYGYSVTIPENDKFLLNQRLVCLRSKNGLTESGFINGIVKTSHFLYHFFNESKGGTGNQSNVGVEDLRNIKVAFPSLPEQQKIASFLSVVDQKIQQLTRKKELLEQYKKGVMQQLFSGKLRFKDENGKAYPKWEEKRLGEISEKVTQKNKNGKLNFVLTNSATQGVVSQSDYFDRDIANQNNLEGYFIVDVNDFVYNPRVSVNAPVGPIKRNKLVKGVMSPLYLVFRFHNSNLDYLEHFFGTTLWFDYLESVANIGARHDRMNIANSDFFNMPIPFPCNEEQQKIASFLTVLDAKIRSMGTQIAHTQTFKKGLLQQMFA